jgi:hypothetical protein
VPCALEGLAVFVQFELTSSSTPIIKAEMRTFIMFTPVLYEVHVTLSLYSCVVSCRSVFVFCALSFGNCIVCSPNTASVNWYLPLFSILETYPHENDVRFVFTLFVLLADSGVHF